jgi:hypothetical protein
MTGTNRDLITHKSSRSYLNHLVVTRHKLEDVGSLLVVLQLLNLKTI